MTADQFEEEYARRSGVPVRWLRDRDYYVVPCDCGVAECAGFRMERGGDR